MYDLPHWQSEITTGSCAQAKRPDTPPRNWPGAPDFTVLPGYLFEKYPETDPINVYGPNRTSQADYFQSAFNGEAISKPNRSGEDVNPDPNIDQIEPTLDTLYVSAGGILGTNKPIMTLYHGSDMPPVVFSGFPLWYFQRQQIIPIVDFVLQGLWGLPRQNVQR